VIRSHEELDVYKLAFKAAMRIFEVSKGFPREEVYSLTDQMRRSSRSVVGNDPERIVSEALTVLNGKGKVGRVPELWDGQAAERIVAVLRKRTCQRS